MFRTALAVAAALLLAACSKQPEDMTVTYTLSGGGMGKITVKAAGNGDARVDSGQQVFIRKDGAEYMLLGDGKGRFAAKVDDFIPVVGELMREGGMKPKGLPPQPEYELVKTGEETVAGEKGEVWKVRPKKTPSETSAEAVISTNPAYANVGKALQMQVRLGAAGVEQMQGGEGGIEKRAKEMLSKGMVLRFGDALKLERIEKGPIAPADIVLPQVLDRAALKMRLAAERDRARAAQPRMQAATGAPAQRAPAAPMPAPALPK